MALFRSRKAADSKSPAAPGGNGSPDALARIDELVSSNRERRDTETERELVAARHAAFGALATDEATAAGGPGPGSRPGLGAAAPGDRAAGAHGGGRPRRNPGLWLRTRSRTARPGHRGAAGRRHRPDLRGLRRGAWSTRKPEGIPKGGTRPSSRCPATAWAADASGTAKAARSGPPTRLALMFDILDTFERVGVQKLITDYLGQRPALSMNKSVLRRVSPKTSGADWHQDGAFLGEGIRSLNVWLTLSHCGDVAPGMDVVPLRLEQIVETGTDGANFDWSVSPAVVEAVAGRRRSRSAHFRGRRCPALRPHVPAPHRIRPRDELRSLRRSRRGSSLRRRIRTIRCRSSSEVVGAAAKARVVSRLRPPARRGLRWTIRAGLDVRDRVTGRRDPLVPPRRWGLPSPLPGVGANVSRPCAR